MTDAEWVNLYWTNWVLLWTYSGTQHGRQDLLAAKAHIELVTGWAWTAPYRLDNPPKITL